MASLLFRYKRHIVLVANTEDVAKDFLSGIRDTLRNNQELRSVFDVKKLTKDGETDMIVNFEDGWEARVRIKGAGQRVRGMNWGAERIRPDLIVIDDLEDDEAVESKERRDKLNQWLQKALLPTLDKQVGQVRVVGTILHNDSTLAKLIGSSAWYSKLYKAHESFDDFTNLLWPEMWSEETLRAERQSYIDMGNPEGYSQEYLNDPSDLQNPFFREEDFLPIDEEDRLKPKHYYIGIDFALSRKTHSDFTVMVVGGYDADGILYIEDVRRMRTDDTSEIVDEVFSLVNRYSPEMLLIEGGAIANAIVPTIEYEMRQRNRFTGVQIYTAIQDKQSRAAAIQQRMRVGGVRVDHDAPWFEDYKHELRRFPRGKKDDQVDATAWLGRGINEFAEAPTQQDVDDWEWELEKEMTDATLDTFDYTVSGY
jgi:predicted phage terminase large subunit-like protein